MVSTPEPPRLVFARALPVILTAVVRDEALIVLIADPTIAGDLVELVIVKVVDDLPAEVIALAEPPITVFVKVLALL